MYTKSTQHAQNMYTYKKATQYAQKQSRIRTQKPHNVRKSRTQTYAKAVNIRKAASSIAQTVCRCFLQIKKQSKVSLHAMKKSPHKTIMVGINQ